MVMRAMKESEQGKGLKVLGVAGGVKSGLTANGTCEQEPGTSKE